ncbi:hypothetical protein QP179_09920 [Sphingomonas aurantiaca]|uniref:hypothetical protein n=1 Tax=Sphingomonas aurantiaca TaxID=185949 RepID=UPI002FE0A2E8
MRKRDIDGIMAGLNETLAYFRLKKAANEAMRRDTIRLTDMNSDELNRALFGDEPDTPDNGA